MDEIYEGPMSLYYILQCHVKIDDITFDDLDAILDNTAEELNFEYRGEARKFGLELDGFAEENLQAEIILKFTFYPYEDEEDELDIIIESVLEKFDTIGLEVEDIEPAGAI